MSRRSGDKTFYNKSVNISPSADIQIIVNNNINNLPKTLITLITTPKKTCYFGNPIFSNSTKRTFPTISTRLIDPHMSSKRGKKLFQIIFCLIGKVLTPI